MHFSSSSVSKTPSTKRQEEGKSSGLYTPPLSESTTFRAHHTRPLLLVHEHGES